MNENIIKNLDEGDKLLKEIKADIGDLVAEVEYLSLQQRMQEMFNRERAYYKQGRLIKMTTLLIQ